MTRNLGAVFAAAALLVGGATGAVAAPVQNAISMKQGSALAPGGAAGVKEAQGWQDSNAAWWVAGGVVVVGGVALIAGGNSNGHHTSTTNSTAHP